jgi:hypothetical protein
LNLRPPRPERGALPADSRGLCIAAKSPSSDSEPHSGERPPRAGGLIAHLPQRRPSACDGEVTLPRVEGAIVCPDSSPWLAYAISSLPYYAASSFATENSKEHRGAQVRSRAAFSRKAPQIQGSQPRAIEHARQFWQLRIAARISVIPLPSAAVHDLGLILGSRNPP